MPAIPIHPAARRDDHVDLNGCWIEVPSAEGSVSIQVEDGEICDQYTPAPNPSSSTSVPISPGLIMLPAPAPLLADAPGPNFNSNHEPNPTGAAEEPAGSPGASTGFEYRPIQTDAEKSGAVALGAGRAARRLLACYRGDLCRRVRPADRRLAHEPKPEPEPGPGPEWGRSGIA
ncbi:hypothetical protein F4811DRAFT_551967 [Daldinia bambusicola]|nr:hypothetical protein F4811DRAFT_551967 [Daldinia bambusicola]